MRSCLQTYSNFPPALVGACGGASPLPNELRASHLTYSQAFHLFSHSTEFYVQELARLVGATAFEGGAIMSTLYVIQQASLFRTFTFVSPSWKHVVHVADALPPTNFP
jgi:hypothetical protein